jgi:hypothetical protein
LSSPTETSRYSASLSPLEVMSAEDIDQWLRQDSRCTNLQLCHKLWSILRKVGLHSGGYSEVVVGPAVIGTITASRGDKQYSFQFLYPAKVSREATFVLPMLMAEEDLIEWVKVKLVENALDQP